MLFISWYNVMHQEQSILRELWSLFCIQPGIHLNLLDKWGRHLRIFQRRAHNLWIIGRAAAGGAGWCEQLTCPFLFLPTCRAQLEVEPWRHNLLILLCFGRAEQGIRVLQISSISLPDSQFWVLDIHWGLHSFHVFWAVGGRSSSELLSRTSWNRSKLVSGEATEF